METNAKKINFQQLKREDFDLDNVISIDEIEKGLFLGNVTAARDVSETLKTRDITYILTVDSVPLPQFVTNNSFLTNMYVQVSDMAKEDLLQYFDSCIQFIQTALDNNKKILVHCYYGMSRSATIVIAYLMKKYKLRYEKAYDKAKSKRKLVSPNSGFVNQLKLFYKMGFKIDANHEKYKIYRLRLAAEKVRRAKILPSNFFDLVKIDPEITQANPEPIVYRCKKCRRIVASKSNLITHKSKEPLDLSYQSPIAVAQVSEPPPAPPKPQIHFLTTLHQEQAAALQSTPTQSVENLAEKLRTSSFSDKSSSDKEKEAVTCTKTFFVEPLGWMNDILNTTEGKLYCPKCKNKLGSFNWLMACRCPCSAQISPPFFYLVPSKVEFSNIVKNVQCTV